MAQAYPGSWDSKLAELFKDKIVKSGVSPGKQNARKIELNARVNFKFNIDMYLASKRIVNQDFRIVRTNTETFNKMKGSVVPGAFWNNELHFNEKAVGFSLFFEDELAATAFTSYIHGSQHEIGIETLTEYRGRGFALHVCSALIDYCLDNDYEPVWSC